MQRTAIAVLVSALVASPIALAQTSNQSSTPMPDRQQATGASQTAGTPANTSATTTDKADANRPGMRATEVPVMSDEERTRARTRLGVGTTMNDVPDRGRANMRQLTVDDLEDMDVYNGKGEQIGSVEEIVAGTDKKQYVVIAEGGFWGVGEDHVVLPLERFWVQGDDRLVVYGVTEEDMERLGGYRDARSNYTGLADNDKADVPEWRERQ